MKITFKETEAAITWEVNGDININPKCVSKFGYIEGFDLEPKDFVFGAEKTGVGIKIVNLPEKKKKTIWDAIKDNKRMPGDIYP